MNNVLTILGILCLGYCFFLMVKQVHFAWIWLLPGLALASCHWWNRIPRGLGVGMGCLAGIGILVLLGTQILILQDIHDKGEPDLSYLVVLGAQVRGAVPSRALNKRIIKASEYLQENPDTIAILSGGQGPGEDITEARCMYDRLVSLGIEPSRLICEERSTSTKENLIYSRELAPLTREKVGLVTQNFHLYRSLKLAKKQGYEQVCGIAAPSEWLYQPHFLVREGFALIKEVLVGNLR